MSRSRSEQNETVIEKILEKTGKSLDEWVEILSKKGPTTPKEKTEWLKVRYNLGRGQAEIIVKTTPDVSAGDDQQRLLGHFSNGKEYLKPVYEKLIRSINKWGKVKVAVNLTYLSLINSRQFAIVKVTRNGLIIGLPASAVKAAKNKNFVSATGLGSEKITHKITLLDESDLNENVIKAVKAAYRKF